MNDVTWHKPNCKPESVKSRFGNDKESIFVVAEDLTEENLLRCAAIGIDLNPFYLELARQEILAAREKRAAAHARRNKRGNRETDC